MKYINKFFLMGCAALGLSLASCDDDKIYDLNHEEANIIGSITFDYEGTLVMPVGGELALETTVLPEEAASEGIMYTSSDPNIAYIGEDDMLHCVSVGTAKVTAVPSIGFGVSAELTVEVVESVVYTTSLSVESEGEMPEYLYEGDELQLKASFLPADHTYNYVTWSSSDPSVISIDDKGLVTCGVPGTATVTATTRKPDTAGITGSLALKVSEAVDVESVEIAPITDPVCISKPFDLDVTYYPAYGTAGSVTWESSDESVAFVNRGKVTPTGFGTCRLIATCRNGNTAFVDVTVTPGWWIWDNTNNWGQWYAGSNAKFDKSGNTLKVTMSEMSAGGNWRGDIVLTNDANNPATFHFGEYPVIALRATIPADGRNTFDAVSTDGVNANNPQCNEGRYATGNPITLSDGTKLIYVDFGARGTYPTNTYTSFRLFQLKVADIPPENVNGDKSYQIYWIRTFKSVEEMQKFAEAEVAAGK